VIRLAIQVPRADAETVLAELLALVPAGLEERDAGGDTVEYVLYGALGELPDVGRLDAAAGGARVQVTATDVPDEDWAERWKAFHAPVDASGRAGAVRVRPPWAPPAATGLDLVIEPGQAFGTGAHHTTRLCLELLLDLEPGGSFADWGCGSGVLAIAAARLGYAPVSACDHDRRALQATEAAAAANGAPGIAVGRVDLRREPGPHAGTVCANLVGPLLREVARGLTRPPGRLIVSGLLREEAGDIAAAFAPHGLREAARRSSGEWSALLLRA
jgi:ribosomal protein L11 methyltransferase